MKDIKYRFHDDDWTIYLISDNDLIISEENNAAEVRFEDREIYFRKGSLTLETILHELFHVYFGYCYLKHTNHMCIEDIEEVSAALFANKGQDMINKGKDILELLKDNK